ncbi:MAG: hypothetical protein SNJ72_02210 [Fimbriimonadales bacterium]
MRTKLGSLVALALGSLALVFAMGTLTACGSKAEEKQAEGYYEGPMQPKNERVGTPGQQASGE